MNWVLHMADFETLVVESASTPECLPMIVDSGYFKRTGISADSIEYSFKGLTSFYSFMWMSVSSNFLRYSIRQEKKKYGRDKLTQPFNMEVMYSYQRAGESSPWKTGLIMKADNLSLHINHQQYIMMLNSLDNQLKDIRDVASMRDKEDKDKGKQKEEATTSV